jgi:uncharacterized glyoxalase superfamily protein PhnB
MLSYEDPLAAADWLADAFGFHETGRLGTHVNLELNGGEIMLDRPGPNYQNPNHHAQVCEQMRTVLDTPFVVDGVYVLVDEIEAHFAQAKAAGATILTDLEDNPSVGQRQYRAADPEGHRWMFAEPANYRPSPPGLPERLRAGTRSGLAETTVRNTANTAARRMRIALIQHHL